MSFFFRSRRESSAAQDFHGCDEVGGGFADGVLQLVAPQFEFGGIVGEVNQPRDNRSDFGKEGPDSYRIKDPLQFTPLSKPLKTKERAEKARLKYSERDRKAIGIGKIQTKG